MNLLDKQLNLAFKFLFIFCLCLLVLRFFNSISFIEPLHVQTGGAEDTSFIGIWFIKNGIYGYDHFLNFKIQINSPNILSLFHYNWLFYYLNATVVTFTQKILSLNDLWLPTIVRITCFILTLLCFIFFYKSLNVLNKTKLSFFLSFYLFFGPLTGFWVISGKPDIFYIVFEVLAIFIILNTQFRRNYINLLLIIILLYFSWSVKQTSVVTITGFALFLLYKKKYTFFLFLVGAFISFLTLTKFFGPNKLFESIFWQGGAAISFDFKHFINVFLDSISKGLVFYVGLICFILNFSKKKKFMVFLKSLNDNQIFILISLILSTSQIFFSFHYGSAVNYYYIFFIYLALFLYSEFNGFIKIKKMKIFFISSIYIQIILISFIFFGIRGSLSPVKYYNIDEFRKCTENLQLPIFSDHKPYYRLPWITPNENPILVTMMYKNFIKDMNFKNTPIFKSIKNGQFKTLIIRNSNKYILKDYEYLKKCKTLNDLDVKIFVKSK